MHGLFGGGPKLPRQLASSSSCTGAVALRHFLTITFSSDFENKFVCGEIMSYDDLKEYGSEASVKAVCLHIRYYHVSIVE